MRRPEYEYAFTERSASLMHGLSESVVHSRDIDALIRPRSCRSGISVPCVTSTVEDCNQERVCKNGRETHGAMMALHPLMG